MDLRTMMIELWQAACQDRPARPSCRVVDGRFVLTVNGNRSQWAEIVQAAGVPSHANQQEEGDTLIASWESHADTLFGAGGPIARQIGDAYEIRPQQLYMGRLVQRAIEMREPAVCEAGTGTGKSFAYAAVCMAMGKRAVISTSNKALQMQLYKKDLPFLQKIFPGRRVALAVGKSNYACRHKAEDQVSGRYAITNPQLLDWYTKTESGNLEEIPFAVDWQELDPIKVDENCLGKMCGRFHECFYYQAKEERALADVIITNHALLCLHQLYPGAGILPDAGVIVVDEAHKLPDYAHNALGVELTLKGLEKAIHKATKHDADTRQGLMALGSLEAALHAYQLRAREPQIALRKDETLPDGLLLAQAMYELADEIWEADILPTNPTDLLAAKDADYIRSRASYVAVVSAETEEKFVRWIDQADKDRLRLANTPWDVSEFIGKLAGFETKRVQAADHTQCARCGRKLTAQTVSVLEGRPYGPDCILYVDPFGDAEKVALAEWLDADHEEAKTEREALATPVIFASATLAAPDMSAFMRECGLPHALQLQVESPFNYRKNALLYVPNGATPDPKDSEYLNYLVDDLRRLVLASGGGAFLLFTSYANMRHCVEALRNDFERRRWAVYVQGELPKLEIARRFAADGNAVLFATKSFFEGVSIDGAALRLVCIDKMPFEAPSPLNNAQEEALRTYAANVLRMPPNTAQWYPLEALRVPKMTIELKQGVGRLIRTAADWGVMAILDPRLRTSRYGRQMVLPSLPPAGLVHHTTHVERFFSERKQEEAERHKAEERRRREAALPVDKVMVYDNEGDLLLWQ